MAETNKCEDVKKETMNPENELYAYLERDAFTSEKYKIEVRGLPKYYGIGELRKLLNEKLNLESSKIKPARKGSSWVYVCFRNDEARQNAITAINGVQWKGSTLRAQVAKPAPDPFVKRKLEGESNSKLRKIDTDEQLLTPAERIKFSTTPLWNISYPDQLELKQKEIRSILLKLGDQIVKENKDLGNWLNTQKSLYNGLPCELMPILHADATEGYRNKCEFTIGKNVDGDKIIIGFRLSSYAAGSISVGPIDDLYHIPECMKTAIKILEEFIQNSGLEAFNPVDHSGNWRQVMARSTRLGHLMLVIGINPKGLSEEKLTEIKEDLKKFFSEGKGIDAKVTSLYLHLMEKKNVGSDNNDKYEHLSGTDYIEEDLLGMKFRISPQAFFQVNTSGAEVLYKAAIDMAEANQDTTVLDVCCGTGTIGLCFSKHCGEVLGLEMIKSAVEDAKVNTKVNEIKNCDFFVGKAEEILSTVVNRATKSNIIAVVDPPRAGLHQRALLSLRRAKNLSRLVYISCDPRAAMKNFVDFARSSSKQYTGEPLIPVKVVAVDLFPHTKHCELIVCLDRVSKVIKPAMESESSNKTE